MTTYALGKGLVTKSSLQQMAASLEIKFAEVELLAKKNSKVDTPAWKDYIRAMIFMSGSEACELCGSPMKSRRIGFRKTSVCALRPVHSYIKDDKQLGPMCDHEMYMVECPTCIETATRHQINNPVSSMEYVEANG